MITDKNVEFLARFGSEEHANQIMGSLGGNTHSLGLEIFKNPIVKSFSYDTTKKLIAKVNPKKSLDLISKEHKMRALHDDDLKKNHDDIFESLTLHDDLNEDDVVKLLKRPESNSNGFYVSRHLMRKAAGLNSDKVKEQIFHTESPELHVRKYSLYSHDDDRLLNHENDVIRDNYATSPNISRDHVAKLLKDKNHEVVVSTIVNNDRKIDTPTLTDLAKNHHSQIVRNAAEDKL